MASGPRFLRPGFLVPVGDRVWALDDVQPVGVLLDAVTGAVRAVHSWTSLAPTAPPGSWPSGWRVCGSGDWLWVQQLGGDVARIGQDGSVRTHPSGGRTMQAVSAHGAWCMDEVPAWSIADPVPGGPAQIRGPGQVTVAPSGGGARTVDVDGPVWEARSDGGDLFLQVETGGWSYRSGGHSTRWPREPATQWLRLPAAAPIPDRLDSTRHASDPPPLPRPSHRNGGQRWGVTWLEPEPRTKPRADVVIEAVGEPAGGLRWRVGAKRYGIERPVCISSLAVAHDPDTGRDVFRVDLGPGEVRARAGTSDHLWLAIDQPRPLSTANPPAPAAVHRLNARTGHLQMLLPADGIDISGRCWALPPRIADTASYEELWRAGLVAHGFTGDGVRIPNPRRAELVDHWPDTHIAILFTSQRHPGLRLRRLVPLYDELGRPWPPEHADLHLDEDLASGTQPYRRPGNDTDVLDI